LKVVAEAHLRGRPVLWEDFTIEHAKNALGRIEPALGLIPLFTDIRCAPEHRSDGYAPAAAQEDQGGHFSRARALQRRGKRGNFADGYSFKLHYYITWLQTRALGRPPRSGSTTKMACACASPSALTECCVSSLSSTPSRPGSKGRPPRLVLSKPVVPALDRAPRPREAFRLSEEQSLSIRGTYSLPTAAPQLGRYEIERTIA
jgi:hypothetical protein